MPEDGCKAHKKGEMGFLTGVNRVKIEYAKAKS
jgi:hypothetical protein